MKPYPVNFKFRAEFDLMPSWLPQVLQDWLEEGWTCDITVKRVKGCYGPKNGACYDRSEHHRGPGGEAQGIKRDDRGQGLRSGGTARTAATGEKITSNEQSDK